MIAESELRTAEWTKLESNSSRGLAARAAALQADDRWFESTRDDFGRMVQLVDTRRLERRAVRQ